MITLSARSLENTLTRKASLYLRHAHRLSDTVADALARQAARQVMMELGGEAMHRGHPAVIRVARELAQALPPHGGAVRQWPLMPATHGRQMREQPLNPVTLQDLSDGSRRSGRRLMSRLPAAVSSALGFTAMRVSQVTPTDPPV